MCKTLGRMRIRIWITIKMESQIGTLIERRFFSNKYPSALSTSCNSTSLRQGEGR
jgi:hypothetical protein